MVEEVKLMRESLHRDISAMDKKVEDALNVQREEFNKLEQNITRQNEDLNQVLTTKIYTNATNINQLLKKNRLLKKENNDLRERLTKIEITQLSNNIILSGMP